jgi:tetratricopeptide (TPR) repeat protein
MALARPLLAALLMAAVAHAAPDELDADTENARRHFQLGSAHYNAQEYELALAEFEKARVIKPLPALDFNIARCLERLERYRDAIDAYRRYLAETQAPDPEAAARIMVLEERLAAFEAATARSREKVAGEAHRDAPPVEQPPPAPVIAPPPTVERPIAPSRPAPRWWLLPVGLGAASVVVAGVGFGLYGDAVASAASLRGSCAPRCQPDQVDHVAALGYAGYALIAVGGALAIADLGIVLYRARARAGGSAWLAPAPGGFVVSGTLP